VESLVRLRTNLPRSLNQWKNFDKTFPSYCKRTAERHAMLHCSCWSLVKYCTTVRKGLLLYANVVEGHSRSLDLPLFDRPYSTFY